VSETQQRAAPASQGMQRIQLPLESYQHPSEPLSDKRVLNLMAEQAPADALTKAALVPTPGMSLTTSCGAGPIWAINNEWGGWYVVSGSHLYRLGTTALDTWTTVDLGDIGAPDVAARDDYLDIITIATGPTGVVVVVPPNAFTCTHADVAIQQMGGTFPGNVSSVAYLDGYFVFTSTLTPESFFISGLADPTLYNALDFAYTETVGGGDVRVIVNNRELWFASPGGWEVWYNAGAADFPFRPQRGAIIPHGTAAPQSIAVGDRSVFWASIDNIIYRSDGYRAVRISTHAIESIINTLGPIFTTAFTITERGHVVYILNYPTRTLAYDCATELWHERASSSAGTGRWRANAAPTVPINGIVGDYNLGNIYRTAPTATVLDYDTQVLRRAITGPIWAATNRAFCARVELEMDLADDSPPTAVTLEWSDDGGRNFPYSRTLTVAAGQKRLYTTRLGSFRHRCFRVSWLGQSTIYGISVDVDGGRS
jgi:hypothetical protein